MSEDGTVLPPEDRSRANAYALIGRIFYGPPDRTLVDYITGVPASGDAVPLAQAWDALREACRTSDVEAVREEYDELFIGVGKSPVTLYTAAYAAPQLPDRHLLSLRERLGEWGLGRRQQAGETEDHLSGVCDVMRWLIEGGAGPDAERRFFFDFVAPAIEPLCAAIDAQARAQFYRRAAAFLLAYYEVERAAFELMTPE